MKRANGVANIGLALAAAGALLACGGGSAAGSGASSGSSASAGGAGVGEPGSASSSTAPEGSGERRSGLQLHIQNMRASGALPDEADPPSDRLSVAFELVLTHNGTEPLTGVHVARTRLVHDDGREIVFGVLNPAWDGRLEPGATRTILFEKTPDSASPRPSRRFCRVPMRVEVTLELAGRTARAVSRRVQIECPNTPTQ